MAAFHGGGYPVEEKACKEGHHEVALDGGFARAIVALRGRPPRGLVLVEPPQPYRGQAEVLAHPLAAHELCIRDVDLHGAGQRRLLTSMDVRMSRGGGEPRSLPGTLAMSRIPF